MPRKPAEETTQPTGMGSETTAPVGGQVGSDFDEPTRLSMSSPYSLASREPTRPLPPSPPAAPLSQSQAAFKPPAGVASAARSPSASLSGIRPARGPGMDDTVTMPRILWDPDGVQTVVRTRIKRKRRRRRSSRDALALTAAKSSLAGLAFATGLAALVALIAVIVM